MIGGRLSPSPPPPQASNNLPPKRPDSSSVSGTLSTSSPIPSGAHHRRATSHSQPQASRSLRSKSPGGTATTTPSPSASGGGSSSPSGRRLERLSADLGLALEDEDLADVRLRCADAPEDGSMDLLAVRAILAVRSRVFKRLLYVTSPEEHSHQDDTVKDSRGRLLVRIGGGLTTGVLRLAVEYCYTGKLSAKVAGTTVEDKIRTQVAAIQAASYLALPDWSCDVEHDVLTRICKHRSLACAVLDEAARLAITAADSRIVDAAWSLIRLCPQQALLPSSSPSAAELFPVSSNSNSNSNSSTTGAATATAMTPTASNRNKSPGRTRASSVGSVQEMTAATSVVRTPGSASTAAATAIAVAPGAGVLALGPAVLRQVISDRKSNANEITLFRCLQRWVSNEDDEKKKPETKKEEGDTARQLFPSGDSPEQEGEGHRREELDQEDTLLSLRRSDMGLAGRRAFVSQLLSEGGTGVDDRPGRGGVLDLSEIAPSDLCTVVMPSGLVPQSQLMQAFQRQALEAELRGVLALRKRRSTFAKNATRAVVSGAGSELVNGTYRLVESTASPQPTFPQYTRTCTFRGRKRRLMLLRSPGKDCDDVFWWIVIKHDVDGREMESGRDWICFYISSRLTPLKGKPRNDEEEDAYDPVPHVWLSFDSWHGTKPPPIVVWT